MFTNFKKIPTIISLVLILIMQLIMYTNLTEHGIL
jgi:hypothetical protein